MNKTVPLEDFESLALAYLALCEGGDEVGIGLEVIKRHLPLSEDGWYLEEEDDERS